MANTAFEHHCQRQHGLITTRQLLDEGYERSQIKSLVRSGHIRSVYVGVYHAVGAPFSWKSHILAAVLAAPEGAVASHESALSLHGLAVPGFNTVHVTVPTGKGRQRADIHIHRSFLPTSHTINVDGIPAANLARCFLDLAAVLSRRRLEELVDESLATSSTSIHKLQGVLADYGARGVAGAAKLRAIVDERAPVEGKTQSHLEVRFLRLVKKWGLPQPELQHRVHIEGHTFYLDAYWPSIGLVVELDGYGVHGTSRKRFDGDRLRNNLLLLRGLTVVHFTARMTDGQIGSVIHPFFRQP